MNKKLSVVFFGTPEFAAAALEKISESRHEVAAVVTAPDRPKGRGRSVQFSEVKEKALSLGLPVLQPTNLKNEAFLNEIQQYKADVFVVVAFRMMPKVLYEMPPLGTFNLHASLLPDYRGAAPINYAIINGETETGVTSFFINDKIDEGEMLLQEKINIDPEEDAGKLHDWLMSLGADVILQTLDALSEGNVKTTPQPSASNKLAYKIHRDDLRIDWNQPAEKVRNFLRGMSPYPGAFTDIELNGEKAQLKIFKGTVSEEKSPAPGNIRREKKSLSVSCADYWISLEELQLQGKKRMSVKDFLNGLKAEDSLSLPNQE